MVRVASRFAVTAIAMLVAAGAHAAPPRVLAYSRTAGFRHDSIETGHAVLAALAQRYGFGVVASESPADFSAANLAAYDVVLFLNTTGDVLDPGGQDALQAFVDGGGGFVGVHSAADTEYDWPYYGALLGNGAWFLAHPPIQAATLVREDAGHPASAHFPASFAFTDEWYNFRANPRTAVQVLLRIDESSYQPGAGAMGADHPLAWSHAQGQGRAFYTNLGHRSETWRDASFQRHLAAALYWAAAEPFDYVFVDGFEPGE